MKPADALAGRAFGVLSKVANAVVGRRPAQVAIRRLVKGLDPSVFAALWDGQNLDGERARPDAESIHMLDDLVREWLATDVVVADVGSRWGVLERWKRFGPHVRVVGFDPDEDECKRLTELEGPGGQVSFVPAALGPANGAANLYLTRSPACSSLYPPVEELIRRRPRLASMAPVGVTTVPLSTLDEWFRTSGHDHIDVIKLDTQGSELGVLEGSVDALATARLLEVEVEFNEMYKGQPLFGDVDHFLRTRNFVLWRIKGMMHYGIDGIPTTVADVVDAQYFDGNAQSIAAGGGQLMWAHAYFVHHDVAFPVPGATSWDQAVRDACAAQAFGFTDLAVNVLHAARELAPADARSQLDGLF